jgi:hypothetical protein
MFTTLNFDIIYLFKYLVLVEAMRNDDEFTIYPHVLIYQINNH